MNTLEFNFSENSFNKLFPFYILIDNSLQIKSYGKSLYKICPTLEKSTSFLDNFSFIKPNLQRPTFEEIIFYTNQLNVIEYIGNGTCFRGQFEVINNASLLFVGSPVFNSLDDVEDKKLTSNDFALHDPLLASLEVFNNQEEISNKLKELLLVVNNQKNDLKKANYEIHNIALFSTKNPDPLIRIDFEGNIINRNPSAEKLTSIFYNEKLYEVKDFFKFIINKIDIDKQRFVFDAKTKMKYYSFVCRSLKDEGFINIYGRDITDQKKDQAELKRLSLVASLNENGVVFTYPNGKIFWCNESYLNLTGYSIEDVLGKTPIEIGKPEEVDINELEQMLTPFYNGQPFNVEHLHRKKSGDNFWVKTKGQPIFNEIGELVQYFAMIEDISLKKRYQDSLQIEKEKYRNIIANMNLGLLEVDINDNIILANQSFRDISGYSLEELKGKNASKLLLTQASQELMHSKKAIRKNGQVDSYEVEVINKNGQKRHWLISGAPNYDFNGKIIGSIGIHLDITEQKKQEAQLYLLSLIAQKNINSVVICEADGTIEWANKSFLEMTGYQMNELIGQKPGQLLQGKESNQETIDYMKDKIAKGLPFNCEIINYSKQDKKYWVSINGQALYNKEAEIIKFFAIQENITEKKELEVQKEFLVESLAKSNKELEDYASVVSHDLKAPLRNIDAQINWFKEDNKSILDENNLKNLDLILANVEKMDLLIKGILDYSSIDKVEFNDRIVDLNVLIDEIIRSINAPRHIDININSQLPKVYGNYFRFQQLFQNLIMNAINYNDKETGIITIDFVEKENEFEFSITDNGIGISEKYQKKVFDIFTKLNSNSRSTGIGLSIVKKIIDLYGGKISIKSQEKIGTTFYFTLPNQNGKS